MKPINKFLKSIACLLALALVLTLLPPAAIAVDTETQEDTSVAKLESGETTTYYADLEEALAAAQSGDTITLLRDAYTNREYSASAIPTVKKGVTVIIPQGVVWTTNKNDLSADGYTLSINGSVINHGILHSNAAVDLMGRFYNIGSITMNSDDYPFVVDGNGISEGLLLNEGVLSGNVTVYAYCINRGNGAISGTVTLTDHTTKYIGAGSPINEWSGKVCTNLTVSHPCDTCNFQCGVTTEHWENGEGICYICGMKVLSADDFIFTPPDNLYYNGEEKTVTLTPKEGITGVGEITIRYYSSASGAGGATPPQSPGSYYIMVNIAAGSVYGAQFRMADESWTFTITNRLGDANRDGFVDAYDASLVKKYSVGLIPASALELSVLDLDGDKTVDAFDASLIQKYSVSAIDKFPCEE